MASRVLPPTSAARAAGRRVGRHAPARGLARGARAGAAPHGALRGGPRAGRRGALSRDRRPARAPAPAPQAADVAAPRPGRARPRRRGLTRHARQPEPGAPGRPSWRPGSSGRPRPEPGSPTGSCGGRGGSPARRSGSGSSSRAGNTCPSTVTGGPRAAGSRRGCRTGCGSTRSCCGSCFPSSRGSCSSAMHGRWPARGSGAGSCGASAGILPIAVAGGPKAFATHLAAASERAAWRRGLRAVPGGRTRGAGRDRAHDRGGRRLRRPAIQRADRADRHRWQRRAVLGRRLVIRILRPHRRRAGGPRPGRPGAAAGSRGEREAAHRAAVGSRR